MAAFIYVCGPSGAGKDSVIARARERLEGHPSFAFAQRLMTRPAEPGSHHRSVSPAEFAALEAAGGLCMSWAAHGFRYGVERQALALVQSGRWVMVSGSREHAPRACVDFPGTRIVVVRASHDLLARRLRERRRESAQALAEREARNLLWPELRGDLEVVNQGRLEDAVRILTDGVLRWLAG